MAALLATPIDHVSHSTYQSIGGSIVFENTTEYAAVRYIETTMFDLSAMVFVRDPVNTTTFVLSYTLADGTKNILWTNTTNSKFIGFAIPKKVYDLHMYVNITQLTLEALPSSSTSASSSPSASPKHYFSWWNPSHLYIILSREQRPNVSVVTPTLAHTNTYSYSYNDQHDIPLVLPNLSFAMSGLSTSTSISTSTYLSSNAIASGMVLLENGTLEITKPIYFEDTIVVSTSNAEGLASSVSLPMRIVSIPRITDLHSVFTSLPVVAHLNKPTTLPLSSIISQGSGPIVWRLYSKYPTSNLSINPLTSEYYFDRNFSTNPAPVEYYSNIYLSTSNYPTNSISINNTIASPPYYANTYINQSDVMLTATNRNGDVASITFDMILANPPILAGVPIDIVASTNSNHPYTYSGMHNKAYNSNTGPLTWSVADSQNRVSINSNTGVLTIEPNTILIEDITISARNLIGATVSKSIHLFIIPIPTFHLPSIITTSIASPLPSDVYTYQIQLDHPDMSQYSTWSIQPYTPQSVSLSSTGLLSIYYQHQYIHEKEFIISAKNIHGEAYSVHTFITAGNTPHIINPGSIRATMYHDPFTYPMRISTPALSTGPLRWSIHDSGSGSGPVLGLTIDETSGILRVANNMPINKTITVTVENNIGGSNSVSFPLCVSQNPLIINPVAISSNIPYDSVFTYQMQTITPNTDLSWYILEGPSNLAINPINGRLTLEPQTIINSIVNVETINIYGESCNVVFNMNINQIPEFICPTALYGNIDPYTFTYSYTFDALSTDIASWSTNARWLSINNSGLLTFTSNVSKMSSPITISATNHNLFTTTKLVSFNALMSPIITSSSIRGNILRGQQFVQSLQYNNSYLPSLTWSLYSDSGTAGITLSSNVLSLNPNTYYDTSVEVKVINSYGASNTVVLPLHVAEIPSIINPPPILANIDPGQVYTYQLQQQSLGSGPLTWSITSIPGLSIDRTSGVVSLDGMMSILSSYIFATATNAVGGSNTIQFSMNIAHTPVMLSPANNTITVSTQYLQNYPYNFQQQTSGTGALTSRLYLGSGVGSAPPGLTFDTNAVLTIPQNTFINNLPITVGLSNAIGGFCNISCLLNSAQTPFFILPSTIGYTKTDSTTPFVYTLSNTAIGTGPLSWSWDHSDPNIAFAVDSVDSNVVTIEVDNNIYVHSPITISASNIYGGIYTQTSTLIVSQLPIIDYPSDPQYLYYNGDVSTVFNKQFTTSTTPFSQTGPLQWSVSDSRLTISSDGLLSYNTPNASITNTQIQIGVSNIVRASCNISLPVCITATPSLSNPGIVRAVMTNADFTYNVPVNNTAACGPLIWDLDAASVAAGLSINSTTGTLRLPIQNKITIPVTVNAVNLNSVSCNITFDIAVAQSPTIVGPATTTAVTCNIIPNISVANPIHVYSMQQTALNTGDLTWYVTDTNSRAISGLNISSGGILSYSGNTYINQVIKVMASNVLGGMSSRQFPIILTHQPRIINPGTISLSLLTGAPYTYQMSNVYAAEGVTTWYFSVPPPSGLSINSTTGVLTLGANQSINNTITVAASNIARGSSNVVFDMMITQTPSIINPGTLTASVGSTQTYAYQYTNAYLRAQPLTWRLTTLNPGASINSSTGMFSLAPPYSLTGTVGIAASNIIGTSVSVNVIMNILRTPIVQMPATGSITSNIVATTSFPMVQPVANTGTVVWSVSPTLPGLTINSNTGTLTVQYETPVNSTITVKATNSNNGVGSATFPINVSPSPVLSSFAILQDSVSSNAVDVTWAGSFVSNVALHAIGSAGAVSSSNSNISESPYTYSNLTPNAAYDFIMIGGNTLQQYSTPIVINNVITLPAYVSNFSVEPSSNQATIQWDDLGNQVDTYSLVVTSKTVPPIVESSNVYSAPLSNKLITSLLPNKPYTAAITPYNYINQSNVSSSNDFWTFGTIPSSGVSNITSSNALAYWDTTAGNYSNINLSLYAIPSSTPLSNITFNSEAFVGLNYLQPNTSYRTLLTPYNDIGVAGYCNVIDFTTDTSPLGPLSFTMISKPNNFILTWGSGDYSYVNVDWTINTVDFSQSNITGPTMEVSLPLPNNTILFTVSSYNSINKMSNRRSLHVVTNDYIAIAYDA